MSSGDHSAVIRADGTLWLAGYNAYGQLGDGTTQQRLSSIQAATGVASVFLGDSFTFWITNDGTLWATGNDSNGQLGDGGNGNRYVATAVSTQVVSGCGGDGHAMIVKTDGSLWASGYNSYGQLGNGTTTSRSTFVQVATSVTSVAAGDNHTLFLKTDGTLWGMGQNFYGQLGDGSTTSRSTPIQIASNVTAIAAGGTTSLFLKSNGSLWGMGENGSGQLGDGTTSDRLTPVQIATNVTQIATGSSHSLFIKTDQTLWAMGANSSHQLADGTTSSRYVPAQVATAVAKVGAGGEHTFYQKIDGTIIAFGYNYYGELATGTNSSPAIPTNLIGPPLISTSPLDRVVSPSYSTTFESTASGPGPITYQWRRNGVPIVSATSSSYSIYSVQETDQGTYDVVVTGRDGASTCSPAVLSVNDPVVITQVPQSVSAFPGQSATFTVEATGTGLLTYQWRKAGVSITGATSSTFTIDPVTAADAASYTCAVSNVVGTVSSGAATLTVAPTVTTTLLPRTVNAGTVVSFSITATGSTFTYQWRRNQSPIASATSSSYSFTAQAANEGSYDVVVTNAAGSATSNAVAVVVNLPVTIVGNPQTVVAQPGQSASFSVVVTGTAGFSYQWRKSGIAIAGATDATLTLNSVSANDIGAYSCVVTNVVGSVTSSSADLRVGPQIISSPLSQTVNPGTPVALSVTAAGSETLSYAWFKNGASVASGATFQISGATKNDEGRYTVLVSNSYGSILSSPADLVVKDGPKITTQPASSNVELGGDAVFSVVAQGTGTLTYQWRKDSTPLPGETFASLVLGEVSEASAGAYDVVVTDTVGSVTSGKATLSLDESPKITVDPQSTSGRPGASLRLSVEAHGAGSLSYQWLLDGELVTGGTSAELQIASLGAQNVGTYRVRISNGAGSVLSAPAEITIAEWRDLVGTYQGLFAQDDDGAGSASPWPGRLTVTVSASGRFTGRLEYGGSSFSVSAPLSSDLTFRRTFPRPPETALDLELQLDPITSTLQASIGLAGQTSPITLSVERHAVHSSRDPSSQTGYYVVALEPEGDAVAGPRAPGYATVKVTATGAVSVAGKLPDGAKISSAGYLGEDGLFPFYQILYKKTYPYAGQVAGPLSLEAAISDQAVGGALDWRKPQQPTGAYASAFAATLTARGTFYLPPSAGEALVELPPGSADFRFTASDEAGQSLLERTVTYSLKQGFKVEASSPGKLTIKVNAKTGLVTGSFLDPDTGKPRAFEGILIPSEAEALGFSLGSPQSAVWFLSPF